MPSSGPSRPGHSWLLPAIWNDPATWYCGWRARTRPGDTAGVHGELCRLVGFQNSATSPDLGFYAARSYSLMRPLRTGRRLIRFRDMSAMGWSGRGGRSWRLR